jgi:hypothetical protein
MSMIDLRPPGDRDFPPGVQDALRRTVRGGVTGRQNRSRRGWLPPLAVAAALLAVIGITGGVLSSDRPGSTHLAVGPDAPTLKPAPGLTATELAKVVARCRTMGATWQHARVYNAASKGGRFVVLFYTPDRVLGCNGDSVSLGGAVKFNPGWFLGAASIDTESFTDARPALKTRGFLLIGGRVPSAAAKVRIHSFGQTVTVNALNGTYATVFQHDYTLADKGRDPGGTITTYRADGSMLGTPTQIPDHTEQHPNCMVTPAGKQIAPGTKPCKTLTPWK